MKICLKNKGKFYFFGTLILPQMSVNFHVVFYNSLIFSPLKVNAVFNTNWALLEMVLGTHKKSPSF